MMKTNNSKPRLFEYDNYRHYIKDLLEWIKLDQKMSIRELSRQAGFKSPNFFQLVAMGKRNISGDSIERFTVAFKLSKDESNFFRSLVLLNQATTTEEKSFYAGQLVRSQNYRKVHPLKKAEHAYYTHWYFIPIREMVALKNFKEDPAWIASNLIPSITPSEAKSALTQLISLGLISRNEEGKLVQTQEFVRSGDAVGSSAVAQFHKEMIRKGSEALDLFEPASREVSSLTLGLSEVNFLRVKEMVKSFKREILAIAAQDTNLERVCQLNFQLFPLNKNNHGSTSSPCPSIGHPEPVEG